jgi:hypothetical protein
MNTDPLERVIRPIVEGQIRGFLHEHPAVVNAVDWYRKRTDKVTTFTNSLSKRIVLDLLCEETRARIEDALFEAWEIEKSGVAPATAPDVAKAGTSTGIVTLPGRGIPSAVRAARVEFVPARAASASLLPQIGWGQ